MQEKTFLINLKTDYFQKKIYKILRRETTHERTPGPATQPTTHKKSKLKLQQEFMNELKADEKDINHKIFWNYFS